MNRLRRAVFITVILAALIYVVLGVWSNVSALKEAFAHFHWWYFPLILCLTLLNYFLRFCNWQFYLASLGIRNIPRKDSLLVYLSGFSMSITPGKVGEVIRAFLLKQAHAIPVSKTASLVFVDRITDVIALVCIAAVGALQFRYGGKALFIFALVIAVVLFVVTNRRICEWILDRLGRLKVLHNRSEKLLELYESSYTLLMPRYIFPIIGLSILSWSCESTGFFLTFKGLGIGAGLLAAYFIYAFSTLVGAASILPGGIGLTEGVMAGLLVLIAVSKADATAATLLIRIATLWFGILVGAISLALFERRFGSTERALERSGG